MTEKKGSVLIASLGDSPGVVTSAIDTLGLAINKVITISTQGSKTCTKDRKGTVSKSPGGFVELLINEFENYPEYNEIEYIYDCIGSSEIENKSECNEFLTTAAKYIKEYQEEGYDVYVCIAGGRKSMSALLAIAGQFYGAEDIFHIAITKCDERKYIETNGSSLSLLRGGNRNKLLHPESAEIVSLPFCNLSSFTKSELGSTENEEGARLLDILLKFSEKIKNGIERDIPPNDPTKREL